MKNHIKNFKEDNSGAYAGLFLIYGFASVLLGIAEVISLALFDTPYLMPDAFYLVYALLSTLLGYMAYGSA